jgi:hypothetical protein
VALGLAGFDPEIDMPPDGIANIAHSPEDLRANVTAQVADKNQPS